MAQYSNAECLHLADNGGKMLIQFDLHVERGLSLHSVCGTILAFLTYTVVVGRTTKLKKVTRIKQLKHRTLSLTTQAGVSKHYSYRCCIAVEPRGC